MDLTSHHLGSSLGFTGRKWSKSLTVKPPHQYSRQPSVERRSEAEQRSESVPCQQYSHQWGYLQGIQDSERQCTQYEEGTHPLALRAEPNTANACDHAQATGP